MPNSLRFVVLCDSLELPLWQSISLREAVEAGVAEPVGVVVRHRKPVKNKISKWRKRYQDRKLLLWRLFNRFYVSRWSKAVHPVHMGKFLEKVPVYFDDPVPITKYREALSIGAMQFVKNSNPDFVLRFGFGILDGEILDCARYGVWSYHHGDPTQFRGQPPGFWEIAKKIPVTGVVLQRLSNELDGGEILHSGFFKTTFQSYAKTRDTIYLGSSSWLRRTCSDIIVNGYRATSQSFNGATGPVFRQPQNLDMLKFLINTVKEFFWAQIIFKLFRQNWNCGIIEAPIQVVAGLEGDEQQSRALNGTIWMPTNRNTFKADPFGYKRKANGDIRILFELFSWQRKLGSIAGVDYKDNVFGPIEPVLDALTHLSYPFIFNRNGVDYFVPEHSAAKDIALFRLDGIGNPDKKTTIFSKSELIDSTFVQWGERFWMFSLDETKSTNTDLHIYFADDIEGPWMAHPMNPVKSDVQSSRPGGTPFVHNGKLFRPSQDCSTHYGSAAVINEVKVLTLTDFQEVTVSRVRPLTNGRYSYGLHTVSAIGDHTLIDGARKTSIFR